MAKSDNIVALCDCDVNAAAREARKQRGTIDKFPKAAEHKDFRVMLEKRRTSTCSSRRRITRTP